MIAKLVLISLALLLASADCFAQPTTREVLTVDLTSTKVIDLFDQNDSRLQPATQPEVVTEGVDKRGRRDRSVLHISVPTLTSFLAATSQPATAVIVIPGGGYGREVFDREGYFVAERLRDSGISAFVLKYRLPAGQTLREGELPVSAVDVLRAVRMIRASAKEWNVNPNRVGVMGFSAGGHVAGSAATEYRDIPADPTSTVDSQSSRPDFAALIYAVSSMHVSIAHAGSRRQMLGPSPTTQAESRFSTAERVDADTPPLFLVHAENDRVVKVENTLEVAAAAARNSVPCEMHLYASGGHGFGLPDPAVEPASWFDAFLRWQQNLPTSSGATQVNK